MVDLRRLSPRTKIALASDEYTLAKWLDKLADDEDEDVRKAVAQNANTSSETLDKLEDDEIEDIRKIVKIKRNK